MIEARLVAEFTAEPIKNNPFYGNYERKDVIEKCLTFSKDEREEIAPCGIKVDAKLRNNDVLTIKVSKHYLEWVYDTNFTAYFSHNENAYELSVWFDGYGEIDAVILNEWLNSSDFDDGLDADNSYSSHNKTLVFENYLK